MKKFVTGILLASVVLLGPVAVSAETASTTVSAQVQSLLAQIANLQAQIKSLQEMQKQIQTVRTEAIGTLSLIRTLRLGMSGDDVKALQAALAADPEIYPEGNISGYYGQMTAQALKRFQKKHGLEQVGYVGPKTLQKLNEALRELGLAREDGNKICIPPGHLVAKGWQKKNSVDLLLPLCNNKDKDKDDDKNEHASTTPILTQSASASVMVGGVISDLAHLAGGNNPTGTISFNLYAPSDTTCSAPLSPAPASATVNGNGNYVSGNSTTTAVGTYRFIATYSGDSKNVSVHTACNGAGSTVNVTAVPDTTAPVISALTSVPAATTTNVTWTTNEPASSTVWFGTSNPFNLASATAVTLPALTISHSVSLSGLATSTAYIYEVVSTDASGNTATSSQAAFTTLSL